MDIPLEISFQNLEQSEFVERRVRERVQRLERHFEHVVGCRVTVEVPHRHHHKGRIYHIRVVIHVPGHELVVSRDPGNIYAHEDVYVAIRDAFDAAERRLAEYAERVRGDVKVHEPPLQGRVARLFPEDGYGFIAAADGREIYFHRNSVAGGRFDDLAVGSTVELAVDEEESAEGPQASTVRPIGELRFQP